LTRVVTFAALTLLLPCGIGHAAPARQDPGAVAAAVRAAAAAIAPPGAAITLGPLTGAQYMASCPGALAVSLAGVEPYEQAAVRCAAPAWTLYVTVTVTAATPVVVAARPVTAGATLTPDDLTVRPEPDSLDAGRRAYHDPAQLIGATAVMNLPAGTILDSSDIAEPVAVVAGQTVAVDVRSGVVDVSINAVADQTGRIGDTILLTNPSSGKRFTALVTAAGLLVQLQS
jgi:flagella basal body P-ring formation protein FlgA